MAHLHEATEGHTPLDESEIKQSGDFSTRTPGRVCRLNTADRIESHMQANRQMLWGFVIYRTTYDDDGQWDEFLRRLQSHLANVFGLCNGLDILELWKLTVFNDPSRFDGMNIESVREHFNCWAETAPEVEQVPDPEDIKSCDDSPRYWYALQVNKESLDSIIRAPPPPARDINDPAWIILIDRIWRPYHPGDEYDSEGSECCGDHGNISMDVAGTGDDSATAVRGGDRDEDDDDTDHGFDGGYEPIDGITTKDVGWIKVAVWSAMPQQYPCLLDTRGMLDDYSRPPFINS